MKNILLILAITFSSASFAQGNLQFNQVISINTSQSWGTGGSSAGWQADLYTVPADKVFKLTSTNIGGSAAAETYTVNGTGVVADSGPIWLAAGDIIGVQGSASCNFCTVSLNGHFSGIEFNIVP